MASQVFGAVPYGFDNELIVLKKPEKYNYLYVLFFPFDVPTWLMLSVSYILNLIIRLTTKKFILRCHNFLRMFLIAWFLAILIVRSSYEGSLFRFIHNRPSKTMPKNIEDAIAEDYQFVVSSKILYDELKDFQKYLIEVGENNMYAGFKELDGKVLWLISDKYLTSYKDKGLNYFITKEPLYTSLQCIYTQKNSFLTLNFRKQIEVMQSFGLSAFLKRVSGIKNFIKGNKNMRMQMPISLQHLKGVFILYSSLMGISLVIFWIEKVSSIKNPCRFKK